MGGECQTDDSKIVYQQQHDDTMWGQIRDLVSIYQMYISLHQLVPVSPSHVMREDFSQPIGEHQLDVIHQWERGLMNTRISLG